jgi:hypothetical protein
LFAPTNGIVPVVEVGAVLGFVDEVLFGFALGHGCDYLVPQDTQVFECFDFGFAVVWAWHGLLLYVWNSETFGNDWPDLQGFVVHVIEHGLIFVVFDAVPFFQRYSYAVE